MGSLLTLKENPTRMKQITTFASKPSGWTAFSENNPPRAIPVANKIEPRRAAIKKSFPRVYPVTIPLSPKQGRLSLIKLFE